MPPLPADDLGTPYLGPRPAARVVSLVPSLTETLAGLRPEALVGATQWCTHPGDLTTTRIRGTKNPDLSAIQRLDPDVVVANMEENREIDVRRLRASGIAVWVTRIETVPTALDSIERLLDGLGWERPGWIDGARELWCAPVPPVHGSTVIPVWRDPWMVVGSKTFTGDVVRRLGFENVFAQAGDRYPHVTLEALLESGADLVLLPDEPFAFAAQDAQDLEPLDCRLVSGRLLTWYGPSLLASHMLREVLAPTRTSHDMGPASRQAHVVREQTGQPRDAGSKPSSQ